MPGWRWLDPRSHQLVVDDNERTIKNFVSAVDGYMKTRGVRHHREDEIVTEMLLLLNEDASNSFVLESAT